MGQLNGGEGGGGDLGCCHLHWVYHHLHHHLLHHHYLHYHLLHYHLLHHHLLYHHLQHHHLHLQDDAVLSDVPSSESQSDCRRLNAVIWCKIFSQIDYKANYSAVTIGYNSLFKVDYIYLLLGSF